MLASSGTEATITYILKLNRVRSPSTISRKIMSDFDWAQIHSCIAVYHAFILLCWWHVLHAWQQHFAIGSNEALWDLLKKWIRMTDITAFNAAWVVIQEIAPAGFVEYLTRYWMPQATVKMWSAVYRTPRSIFEDCDTNMLIEAWHSVLKGKFLHGKRNRRLDHLLSTLLNDVLPYYALKQRRQELGFEGPDIEVKKRRRIVQESKSYTKVDIEQVSEGNYLVKSKSDPSKTYEVDLDTYTCNCLDYPLISYCKHICAVQTLFIETGGPLDGRQPLARPEGVLATDDRPILQVPSLSTLPSTSASLGPASKPKLLTAVGEKLERLAARLRRPRRKSNPDLKLSNLEAALDAMLLATDVGSVLPSAKHLAPVVKEVTARETMMPNVKTRRKVAGDPAYGGGAASGGKAKKPKASASATKSTPSSSHTPHPTHPPHPTYSPHSSPDPLLQAHPSYFSQYYPAAASFPPLSPGPSTAYYWPYPTQ
ncbi:hypothetical protein DFH09DRAFT_945727 [Mycena vulgaris]|nr:hypothetical protein DFH09DRAFT_945727 [Mycena vulgaris]